jgi:hypothetical protein
LSREARIEQRKQHEKDGVGCREIDHTVRAQIEAPGNSLADPGEHDEGIGEPGEERHEQPDHDVKPVLKGIGVGGGRCKSAQKSATPRLARGEAK